jgi:hypothetical protein
MHSLDLYKELPEFAELIYNSLGDLKQIVDRDILTTYDRDQEDSDDDVHYMSHAPNKIDKSDWVRSILKFRSGGRVMSFTEWMKVQKGTGLTITASFRIGTGNNAYSLVTVICEKNKGKLSYIHHTLWKSNSYDDYVGRLLSTHVVGDEIQGILDL